MSLYMETTKVSFDQSVGQIQAILGRYGAAAIQIKYENNEPSGIAFQINVDPHPIMFVLPCRWEPVYAHLQKQRSPRYAFKSEERDKEQAKHVAWRQILRWVEAQLALVQVGMVKTEEVFLAYAQLRSGETVYERLQATKFKMLSHDKEAGK